jgi:Holliday junction resolvase-like predicted endonuclease
MGRSNYSSGHEAEKAAARYLEDKGYEIIELNWRRPVCEDYITPKKLQQMSYAARCWVQEAKYDGDYDLAAIELSSDFKVTDFIEGIDSTP